MPRTTVTNINRKAPTIAVRFANGQHDFSSAAASLILKDTQKETTLACSMLVEPYYLISIGRLGDASMHCTLTTTTVHAHDTITKIMKLQGWQDSKKRL